MPSSPAHHQQHTLQPSLLNAKVTRTKSFKPAKHVTMGHSAAAKNHQNIC